MNLCHDIAQQCWHSVSSVDPAGVMWKGFGWFPSSGVSKEFRLQDSIAVQEEMQYKCNILSYWFNSTSDTQDMQTTITQ